MKPTVEFLNVSKRYNLGMSRTSIPSLISSWVKTAVGKEKAPDKSSRIHWALRDVSFSLERGNSLALIGANGAGKTTILKLLAQITKPNSGQIRVNGKLSALIELGAGFHPDLSGRENIFLNGAILGLKRPDIQRRFDSIVAFSELERFIDTPVKRYSSGMAVRLGFAVAASIDPDVLLVDEVLAVGDSSFRLKCMNRIQELIDNGTTLVFVSHNMGLVKAVCNQGIYIEKGVAQYFGPTNEAIEVYNRALNEHRMNDLEGRKEDVKAQGGTMEIKQVTIERPEVEKKDMLNTNHPATVSIHYQAYQDLGDISVVLRVIRSDGVQCVALYSRVDQIDLQVRKGPGEIAIAFDSLQLFPGTYYLVATLKNRHETLTYDMAYSDWFNVEGDMAGYEDLDAVFEPHRVWNQQATGSNGTPSVVLEANVRKQ